MIEKYETLLDCKNTFREAIPQLIEVFVKFYGEEKRKQIEEQFSKAIFFAYRKPDSTRHLISKLSKAITNELMEQELQRENSSWTSQELLNGGSFEYTTAIASYTKFLELYELGPEGRKEKYIEESYEAVSRYLPDLSKEEFQQMIKTQTIPEKYNHIRPWLRNNLLYFMDLSNVDKEFERSFKAAKDLLEKVDPMITLENYSYYLDNQKLVELNEIAHHFPEILEEYKRRIQKYDSFQQEADLEQKIHFDLGTKYYIKLIEENKELLTEEDLRSFEALKEKPNGFVTERIRKLFGYSITGNHVLDAFTEKSNQELIDGNEWKQNSIKKDRITYFKCCGLDLGEDYSSYEESEEAKALWPTEEQVKHFIESRTRLINEYNIEYYTMQPAHQRMREEIESRELLDKEDPINAALYTQSSGGTMVAPNIVLTRNGYDLLSLVVVNCSDSTGAIDHNIIHELNHLFELSLKGVTGTHYEGICGWDLLYGEINQEEVGPVDTLAGPEPKREYELMNEIVNELIAQDICQILSDQGIYLFDTEENRKIKYNTSYEHTFYIIRDFYEEFKQEIIESRSNGNIEVIWNAVGKENFDALNELFHIHNEHLSGNNIYRMLDALMNGKETELTKIRENIIRKKDEIMEKMRQYKKEQEEKKVSK